MHARWLTLMLLLVFTSAPASAFRSVSFAPDRIAVVDEDNGVIEFSVSFFPDRDVSSFSDAMLSADRRYYGWELREKAIPNAAALTLSLIVVGPHTRLDIEPGQEIHAWRFPDARTVEVCFGPAHGGEPDTCSKFALPE